MNVCVKPFNNPPIKYIEHDIRRIGRQCFPPVYWESIDTVIKECNIDASIFAFNNEGKMQGFILITDDPLFENGPQRHIEFVAVDPDYSGKGIGGLMMKAALLSCNTTQQDIWLDDNLSGFWLHVDTDNYSARRLYEKHGFRIWRHEPDEFGYEGDIMIFAA